MMPVMPPSVNVETKPRANSSGESSRSLPSNSVATQLNTLIPVGTAMIIVAIMK